MKKITIIALLLITATSHSFCFDTFYTAFHQKEKEVTLRLNPKISSLNFYMLAYRGNPYHTSSPVATASIEVYKIIEEQERDEIMYSKIIATDNGISAKVFQGVVNDPNGKISRIYMDLTPVIPADYCCIRIWW